MIMKHFYITFLIIGFIGCNNKLANKAIDGNTIENIKTNEQKKGYLLEILEREQIEPKESISDIILKYGKPSKAYDAYIQENATRNGKNIKLLENYFSAFGYPKIGEVGENAASAPWLVFLQSQNYYVKERNFISLYRGYRSGDMKKRDFMSLLDMMYNHKFGKDFEMEGAYQGDIKIDQQIKILGLDKQILEIK